MKKYLKISILIDNPKSWFHKYTEDLFNLIRGYDPEFCFVKEACDLKKGDVLFILSCDRILTEKQLSLHKNNIVIHASDLPNGRGWSPWSWQIESGVNRVPLTLFEASRKCDAGDYYIKSLILLEGSELIDEIRSKLAKEIFMMLNKYLKNYPMKAIPQKGRPSYFPKRRWKDNELEPDKNIKEQFNKMRVSDNESYPMHFKLAGHEYLLKIFKYERKSAMDKKVKF